MLSVFYLQSGIHRVSLFFMMCTGHAGEGYAVIGPMFETYNAHSQLCFLRPIPKVFFDDDISRHMYSGK